MPLDAFTVINGVSSLAILCFGCTIGAYFLVKYVKTRKHLLPYVSLVGFCLGAFYSGGSASFLATLITGKGVPILVAGLLSYSLVPLAILLGMYLGFTIFQPEHTKKVVVVFAATAIVYYIALFGFPTQMISGTEPTFDDPMTDTGLRSVVLYLSIFYILSVIVILGGGFYRLTKRIEGEERVKARYLTWAWLLFSLAQIIEITILSSLVVIPRVITLVSLFFIYKGFN